MTARKYLWQLFSLHDADELIVHQADSRGERALLAPAHPRPIIIERMVTQLVCRLTALQQGPLEIASIFALAEPRDQLFHLGVTDKSLLEGDFFGTGDLESLTLF